jgi:hypothetical protein
LLQSRARRGTGEELTANEYNDALKNGDGSFYGERIHAAEDKACDARFQAMVKRDLAKAARSLGLQAERLDALADELDAQAELYDTSVQLLIDEFSDRGAESGTSKPQLLCYGM